MAKADNGTSFTAPTTGLNTKDFGINDSDVDSLEDIEDIEDDSDFEADGGRGEEEDEIVAERRRKKRQSEALRRRAGEPVKPEIRELVKLGPKFLDALREVLADP